MDIFRKIHSSSYHHFCPEPMVVVTCYLSGRNKEEGNKEEGVRLFIFDFLRLGAVLSLCYSPTCLLAFRVGGRGSALVWRSQQTTGVPHGHNYAACPNN